MSKYKAIAFDYGGVIEIFGGINPIKITANKLEVPIEQVRQVYFKYNHLSNADNKNWYEMFDFVLGELKVTRKMKEEIIKLIMENKNKSFLNVELIDLISRLKKTGYKIAILSNYTTELRDKLVDQKIDHLFDEVIISGEIGFQKPDRRAFDVLFNTLGLRSDEVIFVDDTVKSLETSEEIGYKPVLFKNNKQFIADLNALHVDIIE